MQEKIIISSLQDLPIAARKVWQILENSDSRKLMLYGEMGAGKTTFTKAFCDFLGVTDSTSSPTFSIVNEYELTNGKVFRHLDLYRLKKLEEALDIGIEDMLLDDSYCFIEWAELIEPILPPNVHRLRISLSAENPNSRVIEFF